MTDNLTKKQRSYCMSQIKGSDTKLERLFRRLLKNKRVKGYKIKNKLIGKPDIYFPNKKIAIFIDGCFWHKCHLCFKKPKSNKKYWQQKIKNNIIRDRKVNRELKKKNIYVLRFWEHEIKKNIKRCFSKFIKIYDKKS